MRVVDGVHDDAAPMHVSRRKMSATRFVSAVTKFVASEANVTKRPSALIEGEPLAASGSLSPNPTETSTVWGMHPAGAPAQVSRR